MIRSDAHYDVLVVGTGIAGSGIARMLAENGLSVAVLERAPEAAAGASGNPRALAQPYPTDNGTDPYPVLLAAGWEAFLRRVSRYNDDVFERTGVVLLPNTVRLKKLRQDGFAVDELALLATADELSERAKMPIGEDGWFLPTSGIIHPRNLIAAELAGIPCFYGEEVREVMQDGDIVRVVTQHSTYTAGYVVLASAHEVGSLPMASFLPVEPVHGEIIVGRCQQSPRIPVCGKGFLLPLSPTECMVGARYRHGFPLEPDPDGLIQMARGLGLTITEPLLVRQSYRCSTHDKCPYAGELLDFDDLMAQKETREFKRQGKAEPRFWDRIIVSVGYGSRGLLLCSLTAEILTEKLVHHREHPLALLTSLHRLTHRLLHRQNTE
ncbi:MAG: hypothetical protein OHK0029_01520 [Armatimonadaceae bacterium]